MPAAGQLDLLEDIKQWGKKNKIPKLFIFAWPDLMKQSAFSSLLAQSDH